MTLDTPPNNEFVSLFQICEPKGNKEGDNYTKTSEAEKHMDEWQLTSSTPF